MKHILGAIAAWVILTGCALNGGDAPSSALPLFAPAPQDVHDLTLQYRIGKDALAPSQFVAVFPNGMTSGLRIDWRIGEQRKRWLEARVSRFEQEGLNGRKFTAEALRRAPAQAVQNTLHGCGTRGHRIS